VVSNGRRATLSLGGLGCYSFGMKVNTWRLVLVLAVLALIIMAFQRPAQALIVSCPQGYTGFESMIVGCCFTAGNPQQLTARYYQYYCDDGLALDITVTCTTAACPT
jgi:hypothetical protein